MGSPGARRGAGFFVAGPQPLADNTGMTLSPLGDSAVVMTFGTGIDATVSARVRAVAAEIKRHPPRGVVDIVPAFASVAVFYDITLIAGYAVFCAELERLAVQAETSMVSAAVNRVEIPVCYGSECGPDLPAVAAHHPMTEEQVVALHSGADYFVQAIGFVPGFPYLGGMPERLAMPRRATPRPHVPGGSVGIGGVQTGVYPFVTPGGWNLVGRTPLRLFDPHRTPPALLHAGDQVRFRSINKSDYEALLGRAKKGDSQETREPAQGNSPASGGAAVTVIRAGLFTTIQDVGRRGQRSDGIAQSGAADPCALQLANTLVGNVAEAAGLEFTLLGPELEFSQETLVAIGGAAFDGLPRWQPFRIPAGTRIAFGHATAGCRGYLACAGGIDLTPVLGSRSTHVQAGIGGLNGRALRDGDVLSLPRVKREMAGHWHLDERILPEYSSQPALRALRGAQAGDFGSAFWGRDFKVTAHSDRMGVRLQGEPLVRDNREELLSSAVAPGTVQIPPDGQPIVLLADAQTIGGYPQVAHVISVDLPLVAQLRPGDTVCFIEVTLAQAHELALARERALAMLREGIAQKLR